MTTEIDDARARDEITDRLVIRFPDRSPAEIGTIVAEVYDGLSQAKVRDFVPVLAEKKAAKRLKG